MNNNLDLVHKSLDTITPGWQSVLVATVTEDGFEYDIFNKMDEAVSYTHLTLPTTPYV